jgi:nucleoside-diphosphate-sugar epimerase
VAGVEDGRTAFVTGGSGFIGGALVRRLVADGWTVTGLARSDASSERVRRAGARPAPGDLDDVEAMRDAASGSDVAFHAAATVAEWGPPGLYERGNVTGTRKALEACRAAGVSRFVHVGTEAALMDGQPLVRADESWPLKPESPVPYCSTKARAEHLVHDANRDGFETVVVRPRLVWGPGDTTILPSLVRSIESGRFSWIGEGRHLTSTTHVDNVVEGLVLAAERGRPGEAYFVTDGEPIEFREFVTRLVATRGVQVPPRNTPPSLARIAAPVAETVWRTLRRRGEPPVTRLAVWLSSLECTIDISKARSELGYEPVVARDEGLAALSAA